jgi:diguanylate cyclase (GGDEF)-like protein
MAEGGQSESSLQADLSAAIIAELKAELSSLRRDVRLLRIANAELERVAICDTLTPLYNRRYFIGALNERIVRAQRYQASSAVLFLDINRMKHINDKFGHSAGDFALVHAAQLVQAHIRKTDVAARLGGDEFALIIEEVDEKQAAKKADHIDHVLRSTECRYGEAVLPVSASIGWAILTPNDTVDSLIERADANMYARKRAWHGGADSVGGQAA